MVRYEGSYSGIGRMLCAPWMVDEMRRRASLVKSAAAASAPVYTRGKHPGRYKAAFSVSADVRGGPKPRARGRVVNDAPEAFIVEFGNRNTPRHRTLGNALVAARGARR